MIHQDELLAPTNSLQPYTISQINDAVSARLESGNTVVWFTGEISNYKRHSSGHCYLRLKDADSQIPAVIWSSAAARLDFDLEDGMEVLGIAALRVYRKGGYYQLDIQRVQPAGLGALYAAFEALKQRLDKEGLFSEEHKKPIPMTVKRLGVVTSKTGAALRDIIRVVCSRAPGTDIVLVNARVQGELAAAEIARAVEQLNEQATVDCIIVGRGGGSIEDLWPFNEERVARAVFDSRIPVISAVGHETDFTICDFVADARAATPSAAAQMAVADSQELCRYAGTTYRRFIDGYGDYFRSRRQHFTQLCQNSALHSPFELLREGRQSLDINREHLERECARQLRDKAQRLRHAAVHLGALSPLAILKRGYAVVSTCSDTVVRCAAQLQAGETVRIRFGSGAAQATITTLSQHSPTPSHQGETTGE
jgi:exodeoxyribonuclease VII large subunit